MSERLYKSIGLPLDTWRLVTDARGSRVIREVVGKYPSDSQVVELLMRYGTAYLRQIEAKEQAFLEEKLGV